MPYIDKTRRRHLDGRASYLESPQPTSPQSVGELTYKLSMQLHHYLGDKGLSYQALAECLGALEGCKADFERRVLAPYEDEAIQRNGDIW